MLRTVFPWTINISPFADLNFKFVLSISGLNSSGIDSNSAISTIVYVEPESIRKSASISPIFPLKYQHVALITSTFASEGPMSFSCSIIAEFLASNSATSGFPNVKVLQWKSFQQSMEWKVWDFACYSEQSKDEEFASFWDQSSHWTDNDFRHFSDNFVHFLV